MLTLTAGTAVTLVAMLGIVNEDPFAFVTCSACERIGTLVETDGIPPWPSDKLWPCVQCAWCWDVTWATGNGP